VHTFACSVRVWSRHRRHRKRKCERARPSRRFVVRWSPSVGCRQCPTRGRASRASRRLRGANPAPATWDCVRPACWARRRRKATTVGWATWPPCRRWRPAIARCAAVTRRRLPWRPSRAPTCCCSCLVSSSSNNNNNNNDNYNKTCWCRQPASLGSEPRRKCTVIRKKSPFYFFNNPVTRRPIFNKIWQAASWENVL